MRGLKNLKLQKVLNVKDLFMMKVYRIKSINT